MSEMTSHCATIPIKDNLAIFLSVEEMRETRNILHYRFAFDFDAPCDKKQDLQEREVIKQIFDMPVFSADNTFMIPVELFGTCDYYYKHDNQITKAIQSHCVIAALHTVKYLRWREEGDGKLQKVVKGNTAAEYVNENLEEGTPGYFYLNSIHYEDSLLDMEKYAYNEYESKVSNFFKQMKEENVRPDMKFAYSLLGKYYDPDRDKNGMINLEIPLYNIDLYHHIISNKAFFMNKVHDKPDMRKDSFIKYMNMYGRAASSTAFIFTPEAKVDNILLRYQLERYLNASLYEYLFQKHKRHHENKENKIVLSGDNYLSIIQKFSLLPNVFSRHLFVDWAYESISYKNVEKIFVNYFDSPIEIKSELVRIGDEENNFVSRLKTPNTEYAVWCYVLERALEYLSTVTFPMYEKTFFICLYEYFSYDIPEKGEKTVLQRMEEVLYRYVAEECGGIFDPDIWEQKLSFLSWDNLDGEQYVDEKKFYLALINKMLYKNDLQDLYKITFDRKYFGLQGDVSYMREIASINYLQRQLMYLKNKSDSRKISI